MSKNGSALPHIRSGHVRVPWWIRVPYRYLITGQEIRGAGDNATFLDDATKDHRGRPREKLTRARWRRVARRNAAVTVPAALTAGIPWVDTWPVLAYEGGLAAGTVGWVAYRGVRAVREMPHNRLVDRVASTLHAQCGVAYRRKDARRYVTIPRGWRPDADEVAPVRVTIPTARVLTATQRRTLVAALGARLGIQSATGSWFDAEDAVTVDITGMPMPPSEVDFGAIRPLLADLPDDVVAVGLAARRRLVTVSLSSDSPHFAASGAAGTGKSVLIKFFMAQRIARGDGAIFVDLKRWSHWRWASKLPRDKAIYAYRIEDIHRAWLDIGAELERRIELDDDADLAALRRVFVVIEEINRTTIRLNRYWRAERKRRMGLAKALLADAVARCDGDRIDGHALAVSEGMVEDDLDLPTQSPAIDAMQDLVGMGREVKMHAVVAAQRLSASVFGGNGGDIRESFQGGKFIARWDRKIWAMLVDTIAYVPCPAGPRGQWGVVRGDVLDMFQAPNLSDAEALDMAMSGVPVSGPVLGHQDMSSVRVLDVDMDMSHVQDIGTRDTRAIESGVRLSDVLSELPAGQDGTPMSLDALRRASTRPGFPAPVGADGTAKLYDRAELIEWRLATVGRVE